MSGKKLITTSETHNTLHRGCKQILSKLSDYLDHDLEPALCEYIDQHLEHCPECKAFINTFRKTVELIKKRHGE
jgi:predicted anti-sigma-YlaC factor YlaD